MRLTGLMRAWIEHVVVDATSIEVIRAMPWAVVARVTRSAPARPVWFKANHEAFAYEAALVARLAEVTGHHLLPLHHRHPDTGWFVMGDGGRPAGPADAPDVIEAYRAVQLAAEPLVDRLIADGVPDMRPSRLPATFDRVIAGADATPFATDLSAGRARFLASCDRLAADARVALVNTDMKLDHAFAGPPIRLFDWGDAVISHPLIGDVALARNFGDLVVSPNDQLARDAARVAPLLNLAVWLRDPPGARDRWPDAIARWLGSLRDSLAVD